MYYVCQEARQVALRFAAPLLPLLMSSFAIKTL
jgi:hypothetical protein